nr:MCP four helix bundle domain-containing protein [Thauera sp. 27]
MKNLKIGIRLGIGFAIVLLLLVAIAAVGSLRLSNLQAEITDIVSDKNVKLSTSNEMIASINLIGMLHRNMLIMRGEQDLRDFAQSTSAERAKLLQNLEKLNGMTYGAEGARLLEAIKTTRQAFMGLQQEFEGLTQQRDFDAAATMFSATYRPAFLAYLDALNGFIAYQTTLTQETGRNAETLAERSVTVLIGLAIAALLVGIGFAIFITRSITRPVGEVSAAAERMARGDFAFDLQSDAKDEVGSVVRAVAGVQTSVKRMIDDASMLADAAIAGKLATRADASRHEGDFRKIVDGVNATLDAVIGPLNVAADYVDQIAKGAIPARITDSYNGDFNTIKNNLNTAIDAVNALVTDANMLAQAAVEGRLSTRADASRHHGDYARIVQGVNATLDAVIAPIDDGQARHGRALRGRPHPEDHRQLRRRLPGAAERSQRVHGQARRDHRAGPWRGRCAHQRRRPGLGHRSEPVPVLLRAGRQRRGNLGFDRADERLDQPELGKRQDHRRHGHQGRLRSRRGRPGRQIHGRGDEEHRRQDRHHR